MGLGSGFGTTAQLTPGIWYRLSGSITLAGIDGGSGQELWDLDGQLHDIGADGTSAPTQVLSGSVAGRGITMPAGPTRYFFGWRLDDGNELIDNAVVTPEPCTMALLAFGIAGVLRRR